MRCRRTQLAPAVQLGGIARDTDFETALQNALDAETAIAEARAAVEDKRVDRDQKVAALQSKIALVVNGVIGSPNSDLYGAMSADGRTRRGDEGCVRLRSDGPRRIRGKSQRKSGLTQKSNVPAPAPAPPAH